VGYVRQGADKERRWLGLTLIELMVAMAVEEQRWVSIDTRRWRVEIRNKFKIQMFKFSRLTVLVI
jgi:hypothetical protein